MTTLCSWVSLKPTASADEYIAALTGLLQVTVRLDVKKIIAEGNDAAIFFELETKAPAEGTVLVAEWHQFKNSKISHVASAFDGRSYEAMFTGKAGREVMIKPKTDTARHEQDIRKLKEVFATGFLK